jgi:hypothetical protein
VYAPNGRTWEDMVADQQDVWHFVKLISIAAIAEMITAGLATIEEKEE